MANSGTERGGKYQRPSWNYKKPNANGEWPGHDSASVEMLESIRNVLEGIADNQMQACDVAQAIKAMSKAVVRVEKRLAKVETLKLK